jgi:hypothetical protein
MLSQDPINSFLAHLDCFVLTEEATMYRRRCSEIKNGRVAQLATIGMVMGDLYTFPGYLSKFSSEVSDDLLELCGTPVHRG